MRRVSACWRSQSGIWGSVSAVGYRPAVLTDCFRLSPGLQQRPGESQMLAPQVLGTGAGPSGWKADTKGVLLPLTGVGGPIARKTGNFHSEAPGVGATCAGMVRSARPGAVP